MRNSVRFECTSLAGTSKVGNLKQDEDGYYELVVGALNVYNSAGQYYVFDQAKELFQQSSQLMRRVKRGVLRGEYGHPKMEPGMTDAQFANRIMSIYEHNVCCHHKEITLDFDRVRDKDGRPVIAIISKVLPSGPQGEFLKKSLDNPNENVCFSIRAFTDDYREGALTKRVLKTIVTWDFVTEPGIAVAEKFISPALESHFGMEMSRGTIKRAVEASKALPAGMGMESVSLTADELFQSMGWYQSPGERPAFASW